MSRFALRYPEREFGERRSVAAAAFRLALWGAFWLCIAALVVCVALFVGARG